MSLDDQKAKCHRLLESPDGDSAPVNAHESGKTRLNFSATDYIVYPAHGVGQILAIEEQTVVGASLEFFLIFFAKSGMTLRVPEGRDRRNARAIESLLGPRSETDFERSSPKSPRQLVPACSGM